MAKDPAFLFYFKDFIMGTAFMSLEERGAYITLLCYQADKGHLTTKEISTLICGPIWDAICCKFSIDDNGCYYNKVLDAVMEKRRAFTDSRRKNLHMGSHMQSHMEAHMGNGNGNGNKDVKDVINAVDAVKNAVPKFDFDAVWNRYPKKLGKKEAARHFKATVKTDQDYADIQTALKNFLEIRLPRINDPRYIPHGATWFNNWREYINYSEPLSQKEKDDEIRRKIFRNPVLNHT